jgi:para-aminobenzoate synthetase component 1
MLKFFYNRLGEDSPNSPDYDANARKSENQSGAYIEYVSTGSAALTTQLPIRWGVTKEIPYADPITLFYPFSSWNGSILFDSATAPTENARYSFIGIDPFKILSFKDETDENPFDTLDYLLKEFQTPIDSSAPDLPPWQGGFAGYFGYHLCHYLEELPRQKSDEMAFPDLLGGLYDLVIGIDHHQQKAWIISSGLPEKDPEKRQKRAQERLSFLESHLILSSLPPLSSSLCSPPYSNFTQAEYKKILQKTIDYIYEGDIYQANISRCFTSLLSPDLLPFDLYRRLRDINAAPFAAYLTFDDVVIASASPERFIQLKDGIVETRPIKGTRRRSSDLHQDQQAAEELKHSQKDQAENVMIVDLLRNDLSRVCEPGSIHVPKLLALESYATVHHLVSTITGKLQQGLGPVDLLKATFPGGSITGAPKIRAMEIIAELEPSQRGPYCGSIGYIGFDGTMDTNIVIRTYALKGNKITFQAGGGIVADSNPAEEFHETTTKAAALVKALVP